jgi:hypothetical protein
VLLCEPQSTLWSLPEDNQLIQIASLDSKSESIFERNAFDERFPNPLGRTDTIFSCIAMLTPTAVI